MIEDLAVACGVDAILTPFQGAHAVGIDLRTDFTPNSLYYRLRDARAEARAVERQSDAASSADATAALEWRTVRQLAIAALKDMTKDLEIAAWLTEALVREEGIGGLGVGARVMAGLTRNFWNAGLYPQADEDGIVTRVAPVTGLNGEGSDGTLIQPLRKQIFFRRPSGEPVAFWEFEAAERLQGEADQKKRQQGLAAGILPFEELERDARAVGGATFNALRHQIRAAQAAWTSLGEALDEAAGADGPPTGRVRDLLENMLSAVARYASKEEESAMVAPMEVQPVADGSPSTEPATVPAMSRNAETREDMLRELTRIADFFRRTEPHSPLAYTLDDAVRRARMSWPDLLAEIVPDAATRSQMLRQLGIKPEAS
jgi:type VI secretion system protein ImpA